MSLLRWFHRSDPYKSGRFIAPPMRWQKFEVLPPKEPWRDYVPCGYGLAELEKLSREAWDEGDYHHYRLYAMLASLLRDRRR